jgi:hypothetical protein
VGTCVRAGLRLGRTHRDRYTCTHLSRTIHTNNTPHLPTCLSTYLHSRQPSTQRCNPPCPCLPAHPPFSHRQRSLLRIHHSPFVDASHRRIQPASKLCKTHLHRRSHATAPLCCLAAYPCSVPFSTSLSTSFYTDTAQKRGAEARNRQREKKTETETVSAGAERETHPPTHARCTLATLAARCRAWRHARCPERAGRGPAGRCAGLGRPVVVGL